MTLPLRTLGLRVALGLGIAACEGESIPLPTTPSATGQDPEAARAQALAERCDSWCKSVHSCRSVEERGAHPGEICVVQDLTAMLDACVQICQAEAPSRECLTCEIDRAEGHQRCEAWSECAGICGGQSPRAMAAATPEFAFTCYPAWPNTPFACGAAPAEYAYTPLALSGPEASYRGPGTVLAISPLHLRTDTGELVELLLSDGQTAGLQLGETVEFDYHSACFPETAHCETQLVVRRPGGPFLVVAWDTRPEDLPRVEDLTLELRPLDCIIEGDGCALAVPFELVVTQGGAQVVTSPQTWTQGSGLRVANGLSAHRERRECGRRVDRTVGAVLRDP